MKNTRNGHNPIRCPQCGGAAKQQFTMRHASVWRCTMRSCGLQFAHPQLSEADLRRAYERFYYPAESEKAAPFENTPDCVLRQVFASLQRRVGRLAGLRLLDYGCGTGSLLRVAQEFGMSGAGIEPDPHARRASRKTTVLDIYPTIEHLLKARPLLRFHFVVLWTVVEHLRRPWDDLASLRTLLTVRGSLLLSTINTRCLRARLEGKRWGQYQNPTHFYYFDRQSLAHVLRRAGFAEPSEWRLRLRFPHHSAPRRWLHHASFTMRLSDGLLYLCQRSASADQVRGDRQPSRTCAPELKEGIGSVV